MLEKVFLWNDQYLIWSMFLRYEEQSSEEYWASKKPTSCSENQTLHRQNEPKMLKIQLHKGSVNTQHIYNMALFWLSRLKKKKKLYIRVIFYAINNFWETKKGYL